MFKAFPRICLPCVLGAGWLLLLQPLHAHAREERLDDRIAALIDKLDKPGAGMAKARTELTEIGAPAVPALIKALHHSESHVRNQAGAVLKELGSAARPALPAAIEAIQNPELRSQGAFEVIAALGPDAAGAVPVLAAELRKQDRIWDGLVRMALAKIGAPAIPAMVEVLKEPEVRVRYNATAVLRQIGEPGVRALVARLNDEDAAMRERTAQAVGWVGRPAAPMLSEILRNGNSRARGAALAAVLNLGTNAVEMVPALVHVVERNDPIQRVPALEALAGLGLGAKEAVPALKKFADSPDVELQRLIARTLASIDPESTGKLDAPTTLAWLRDGNPVRRIAAVRNLAESMMPAGDQTPLLIAAIKDMHPAVSEAAIAMLERLGANTIAAIPALATTMRVAEEPVRVRALEALRSMGPGVAETAVPALIEAEQKLAVGGSKEQLAEAFGIYGPQAQDAVPVLLRLIVRESAAAPRRKAIDSLRSIDASQVHVALRQVIEQMKAPRQGRPWPGPSLQDFGEDAAAAVPDLITLLQEGEPERAPGIMEAIASIGSVALPGLTNALAGATNLFARCNMVTVLGQLNSASAFPALQQACRDPEPSVRKMAVGGLTRLGKAFAAEAAPLLAGALHDPDESVAGAACMGLFTLGEKARIAVPDLITLTGSANSRLSYSAAQALHSIDKSRAPEAADVFCRILESGDADMHHSASRGLRTLKSDVTPAVIARLAALQVAPDLLQRVRAMAAYAGVDESAGAQATAVAVMAGVVASPDSGPARATAIVELGMLRAQAKDAVQVLLPALDDPDAAIRQLAARALGQIGPHAAEAIPSLGRLTHDANRSVSRTAEEALRQIQSPLP